MAFTATSAPHQSPQSSVRALSQKQINYGTWGTGGNTCVITDPYIRENSHVQVYVTGTTPAAGLWAVDTVAGTTTVTSSNAENAALTIAYVIY